MNQKEFNEIKIVLFLDFKSIIIEWIRKRQFLIGQKLEFPVLIPLLIYIFFNIFSTKIWPIKIYIVGFEKLITT